MKKFTILLAAVPALLSLDSISARYYNDYNSYADLPQRKRPGWLTNELRRILDRAAYASGYDLKRSFQDYLNVLSQANTPGRTAHNSLRNASSRAIIKMYDFALENERRYGHDPAYLAFVDALREKMRYVSRRDYRGGMGSWG